jgi:hypothetical protein
MASVAETLIKSSLDLVSQPLKSGEGIAIGAQLAQNMENLKFQREQMEQQKQQLQMQKVDKLTSAMEAGAKMKSKSARNAFFKTYIPQMQAALGLKDFVPEATMAMIQADPEQAKKFSLLKTKIMNGDLDYNQAIAQMEPEAWATLDESEVVQLEAAEKFRIQQEEQNKRAASPNSRLSEQFDTRELSKLNNDVRTAFKPIEDQKKALRTAYDSLNSIQADLAANKKPSSIDFNVGARMLAKAANSGAMTDDDVNDFKVLSGLEDMSEASIKKYLTGGAPAAAVSALIKIANRSAKNLDQQAATIQEGFKSRISLFQDQAKAFEASGLKAYSKPTLGGGSAKFTPSAEQKSKFKAMSPEKQNANAKALAEKFKMSVDQVKESLK